MSLLIGFAVCALAAFAGPGDAADRWLGFTLCSCCWTLILVAGAAL